MHDDVAIISATLEVIDQNNNNKKIHTMRLVILELKICLSDVLMCWLALDVSIVVERSILVTKVNYHNFINK